MSAETRRFSARKKFFALWIAIMMIVSCKTYRDYKMFKDHPIEAIAEVVAIDMDNHDNVEYRFSARGKFWTGSFFRGPAIDRYKVGAKFTVYYSSVNPSINSLIAPNDSLPIRKTFALVVFCFFITVMIIGCLDKIFRAA